MTDDQETDDDTQYRVPEYMESARFLRPDESRKLFSRDPGDYRLTEQSMTRLNQLRGIFTGNDINKTIQNGHMVPGANNTMVFASEHDGVVLYVVALHIEDDHFERGSYPIKTVWSYVYNRGLAWSLGWDSDDLDTIESLKPDSLY